MELWEALHEVKDPELPAISIVELGMVQRVIVDLPQVEVEVTPTFVGCPALGMIKEEIVARLSQETGVQDVYVRFVMDPPWTSDRITPEGHQKLKEFGIAPPSTDISQLPSCPYCGAAETQIENLFGPTACRAVFYCKRCREPFEGIKKVSTANYLKG